MASIGAVLAGMRNEIATKAEDLPIEIFEIKLRRLNQRMWFEPGDIISGYINLKTLEEFKCYGVDIALEGSAAVNYQSGGATKTKSENLLPYDWATVNFFGGSDRQLCIQVPKGHHRLDFSIPVIKLNPFLGSFKANSGFVEYKIAAHIQYQYYSLKTEERNIRMKSHYNINLIPEVLSNKPYVTDGPIKKSIFSSSSSLKFRLTLPQMAAVAGESLQFHLELFNPHDKKISRRFLTLMKKTTFQGESTYKCSKLMLDSRTTVDQSDLEWSDSITVPKTSYPSTDDTIIQHQYFIVLEVFTDDKKEPKLKAEIPIIVGTEDELDISGASLSDSPDQGRSNPPSSPRRASQPQQPPRYSNLSTRATSFDGSSPPKYENVAE